MAGRFTFLLGGARSGKSSFAQSLAERWGGAVCVVATAEPVDDDMRERISRHRAERPAGWVTVEEPLAVAAAASRAGAMPVVLDCMTVWLGNAMHHGWSEERIRREVDDLADVLCSRSAASIVVSNEVGMGIHPETELGRHYRDVLGRVNAALAARATDSYLLVAGRLLHLGDPASVLGPSTESGGNRGV